MAKSAVKEGKAGKSKDKSEKSSGPKGRPRQEIDEALVKRVVKMRNKDDMKWDAIASEIGTTQGKAQYLYMVGTCDKIEGTDAQVRKAIVKARSKDNESWGMISARTGLTEGRCRTIFEEETGEVALGNRVGKGGRYPGGESSSNGSGKSSGGGKSAAAKKAAGKTASADGKVKNLGDMNKKELSERMTGKVVTFKDGGSTSKATVAKVTDLTKGEVTFVDDDGDEIQISVDDIKKVSR